MAHWDEASVTKSGTKMLNEMMAGYGLNLTSARGGTGRVNADSLGDQEALLEPRQIFHLVDEQDGPNGKTVTVQITNRGVEEEYLLQQIGVYAELEQDWGRRKKACCLLCRIRTV